MFMYTVKNFISCVFVIIIYFPGYIKSKSRLLLIVSVSLLLIFSSCRIGHFDF